jgi:hypothetical protein
VNYNCVLKKGWGNNIKTKKYITYISLSLLKKKGEEEEEERERERERRRRRFFTDGSIMMLTICRYTHKTKQNSFFENYTYYVKSLPIS